MRPPLDTVAARFGCSIRTTRIVDVSALLRKRQTAYADAIGPAVLSRSVAGLERLASATDFRSARIPWCTGDANVFDLGV